jgi:hypothetical protein
LRINPNRNELPSITIINFLKDKKITIVNKSETIDKEFSKILISIRKGNKRGFISLCVSKDHLLKTKINFSGKTESIITRNIMDVLESIDKNIVV